MSQLTKWVGAGVILAVWVFGTAAPAQAGDAAVCPVCAKASDQTASYPAKAGCTLMRGVVNTGLGWTELLVQPAQEVKAGGNLGVGLGKGVGNAVKRTLFGVAEVLTFWTPRMQGEYKTFAKDCPVCMGR